MFRDRGGGNMTKTKFIITDNIYDGVNHYFINDCISVKWGKNLEW